jgi:multidrug efflux pump
VQFVDQDRHGSKRGRNGERAEDAPEIPAEAEKKTADRRTQDVPRRPTPSIQLATDAGQYPLIANVRGNTSSWVGLSYQEQLAGSQATLLYIASMIVVFLCLAALYESWSIPFSIILVVPVGVFSALFAAWAFDQSNDVYFKVGLLTTIGLTAKNAILIVEFAKDLHEKGSSLVEAVLQAARLRLRPIIITSLAFVLGVLPLAVASGAGSAAQNAIGIGVMGGMLAATLLGVFFVPFLFVAIMQLFRRAEKS